MQSEYLYPKIADRLTVGAWEDAGIWTLCEQVHDRVAESLSDYYSSDYFSVYIDTGTDRTVCH